MDEEVNEYKEEKALTVNENSVPHPEKSQV
jgi:hypothetical protein